MDNPEKLTTQGTQDTGQINVREYQRGNQIQTIQRNWQHRVHKTQDEDKQNKNTTQYVLAPTMCKQTQKNVNKYKYVENDIISGQINKRTKD